MIRIHDTNQRLAFSWVSGETRHKLALNTGLRLLSFGKHIRFPQRKGPTSPLSGLLRRREVFSFVCMLTSVPLEALRYGLRRVDHHLNEAISNRHLACRLETSACASVRSRLRWSYSSRLSH